MTAIDRAVSHSPLAPAAVTAATMQDDPAATTPSFADLLAGLVKPCNGSAGFLEDEHAAAGPDLPASQRADVFDEHGLFYGLGSSVAQASGVAPAAITPQPASTARASAAVGEMAAGYEVAPVFPPTLTSPAAAPIRLDDATIDASTFPTGAGPAERATGAIAQVPSFKAQSVARAVVETMQPAIDAEDDPAARPARTSRTASYDDARATNDLSASLVPLDHGHAVVVHAGALDRTARQKLRDRVVALLSRNGLIARTLRIDGRTLFDKGR